jgi:glycosyltransferase involved in cell wall biosynthesis
MAQVGASVVEVNEPDRTSTAQRVADARRPWRAVGRVWTMARTWRRLERDARRTMRRHSIDAMLIGYLGHFDVIAARLAFPRTTIVLDHLVFAEDTAADRGIGGRFTAWALRRLDRLALRCATLVLLDTNEHRQLVPPRLRAKTQVIPVGAPDAWFTAGVARRSLPGHGAALPLRVVFYGLFTPLQGAPVIAHALALLAERGVRIEPTIVGTGQDDDAAREALGTTPVIWHRWIEPLALPNLVASHDVCLGIFGTSAKALRVVPNKVYQGLAAGCAVITSDTGAQRRVLKDAVMYVPPGDAVALADAIAALANDRDRLASIAAHGASFSREHFTPIVLGQVLSDRIQELGS